MDLLWVTKADLDDIGSKDFAPHNPQGKEKVFFACHPADFKRCFYDIAADIFKTQDCAIYYNPDPEAMWSEEELDLDFAKMQLLVVPITSNFLFGKNRAKDIEFQYAISHHIPILPLMIEGGLDRAFNAVCGDLQFLCKADSDPTALPYEKKLETFLQSVLLGDELAQKVRDAFCAYVFLSYRKKDRKYAQELMRLIHKNDFARDIAIWYDEYLTPGENFNDAIADAMAKSELFALVVTPNLLNEENYVKNVEYPEAVKAKKKILPVIMKRIWPLGLKRKFTALPKPISSKNETALSQALTEALRDIALSENNSDPRHLFFIGLAYLGGIDVEVDKEKAVTLIQTAAEAGLLEAIRKLVSMYRKGEGVPRDYQQSILWQKKLVEKLKERFRNEPTLKNAEALFYELWYCGDFYYGVGNVSLAKAVYDEMCLFAEQINRQADFARNVSVCHNLLGNMEKAAGNFDVARSHYESALGLTEKLVETSGEKEAKRDLAIVHNNLGILAEDSGDPKAANTHYLKALTILLTLAGETDDSTTKRFAAVGYHNLGNVANTVGDTKTARAYYTEALKIQEELAKEAKGIEVRRDLAVSYDKLGDLARSAEDFATAATYYEKSLQIALELTNETETLVAKRQLSVCYDNLGGIAADVGEPNKAKAYYEKSLKIVSEIAKTSETIEAKRDLAISYEKCGNAEQLFGNLNGARKYYELSLTLRAELAKKLRTAESYDDYAAGLCLLAPLREDGVELVSRAFHIYQKLAEAHPDVPAYAEKLKFLSDLLNS